MRKRVLATALAAVVAVPVLALAAAPLRVRFEGCGVPVHETVQVEHTASGPVQVRTWSWRGPGGAALLRVSASEGGTGMPRWALRQLRLMQAQMAQMQAMQAALLQPMRVWPAPLPALLARPAWMPAPPLQMHLLRPGVPTIALPQPVIVLHLAAPAPPAPRPAAPAHPPGELT